MAVPGPTSTGDWVGSVLPALLLPLIGAVLGVYYAIQGRGRRQVGLTMMAVALAAMVVYVSLFGQDPR